MDKLALESHRRAAAAEDRGVTLRSIVPLDVPRPDGSLQRIERDEGIRRSEISASAWWKSCCKWRFRTCR
jgi:acetyl-CoA acyltransferase